MNITNTMHCNAWLIPVGWSKSHTTLTVIQYIYMYNIIIFIEFKYSGITEKVSGLWCWTLLSAIMRTVHYFTTLQSQYWIIITKDNITPQISAVVMIWPCPPGTFSLFLCGDQLWAEWLSFPCEFEVMYWIICIVVAYWLIWLMFCSWERFWIFRFSFTRDNFTRAPTILSSYKAYNNYHVVSSNTLNQWGICT